ncbi:hypothetical protein FQR65_LT13260 [Abscondita terminalis]|nr:hypothetical protein FQR65_LT13260 [Abscondita terminalis]
MFIISSQTNGKHNIMMYHFSSPHQFHFRYVGMFLMSEPVLVIRDPKLFKEILIKEFKTFSNRRTTVSPEVDYLWSQNLLVIEATEHWHRLRTTLSPGFSTAKLKSMFSDISQNAQMLLGNHYNDDGIADIEIKEAAFMYGFESVFKVVFDVDVERSSNFKDKLRNAMRELIDFRGIRGLMINLKLFSFFLKVTKTAIISNTLGNFLSQLVKQTIKERKEKTFVKPDLFQLLIKAQENKSFVEKLENNHDFKITNDVITSQLIIFSFAGVDTISTVLSYAVYELAVNPNVQAKLQSEVDDTQRECNGNISYTALNKMKYLAMVISEVLRKWPPFVEANRVSVKSYTIKAENNEEWDLVLDKNTTIILPIGATHYNPKYFPNPEKFDPERFSQENAKNIVPYTFAPFGHGPRNCIALRFALLEVKIGLVEILKDCNIVRTAKTRVPLKLNKDDFNPLPDDGIWVVDTISTVLSYAVYELAVNPNVQAKLQSEVDDTQRECNGNISYTALNKMKYLAMVISEVLRKWPPFVEVNRVSVKSYTIKAENNEERDLVLNKNTSIILPIHATHYNPKYFPNPEVFDPERFNEENSKNIVPYTFLPFGHGPRNCIALRFALLEVKIGLVEILKDCNIVRTAKTRVPLKLNKDDFNPLPDDGIWPLRYWKERHVKYVSAIPIFGSCLSLLTRQRSNIDFFNYVYNKYPNERYVGMFLMTEPVLVIRDPNLFKEIFIKEFKTFPNRRMTVPLEVDHLWSENLFSIGPAHKWHRLRNILNPRFSSGKLKSMFSEITQNAKMLLDNRYDEDGIAEIESKEASFMYAFEVSFKLLFDFNIEKSNDFKSKLRDAMKELIDFRGIKGLMVNLKFHPILLKVLLGYSQSKDWIDYRDLELYDTTTTADLSVYCKKPGLQCGGCKNVIMCTLDEGVYTAELIRECGNKYCDAGVCAAVPPIDCVPSATFECRSIEGMYPDSQSCKNYYFCLKASQTAKPLPSKRTCEDNYAYNPLTTYCDKILPTNGSCPVSSIPKCGSDGQAAALKENPTIYFICSPLPITGIDVLYPYLYACKHGRKFDAVTFTCK